MFFRGGVFLAPLPEVLAPRGLAAAGGAFLAGLDFFPVRVLAMVAEVKFCFVDEQGKVGL